MSLDNEIFTIKSNLGWFDKVPGKIKEIYLDQLRWNGAFNEVHLKYKKPLFGKRKVTERTFAGVWGWNSWCGIHTFPLLCGPGIMDIYKATVDVGFTHLEGGTGLLPHAVIHENGIFASQPTYKCYGGIHDEAYNLDNMLCWAKMAMEYFLATTDKIWFDETKLGIVCTTVDYILDNLMEKYNPQLVYTGIEGDWTENTNWEGDNANTNANMLDTLDLLIKCESLLGQKVGKHDYQESYDQIWHSFNNDVSEGGLWCDEKGYYVHGNDGKGGKIYGDTYFESTVNYLSMLWNIVPDDHASKIWSFIDMHHDEIELPFPVLTNYKPRVNARRMHYKKTVTNGDIWMVLGAHAAAARLQYGYLKDGTAMYKAILDYLSAKGYLHNNIYPDGKVNDSWDPEVANNGAMFAPITFGILGVKYHAQGLEFNLMNLIGLESLEMDFFFDGKKHSIIVKWGDGEFTRATISDGSSERTSTRRNFILKRGDGVQFLRVD
ncbi:MAG: hypothetical protein ACTSUE_18320 [Promethearchaeota archaeon]